MFTSFGDLASSFQTRHLSAQLKRDLQQLGTELTTGIKSDLTSSVTGDFGPLAGIERSLKLIETHEQTAQETAALMTAAQLSLDTARAQSEALSENLIAAISSSNDTLIQASSADAKARFASVVSGLNAQVAGRAIFSGAATDTSPLMSVEDILTELEVAISAETTATGVAARIDEWFDTPGGGFETAGYLGSDQAMGPLPIGEDDSVEFDFKANDPKIRDVLKAFAKSAMISEGALDGDLASQIELSELASSDILNAIDGIVLFSAELGVNEARVEDALVRNSAQKTALELSRNEITVADPYETAAKLEAVYGQMETLYTVTAHLSKLNFSDYMS